jgi:hypothetical protein
MVFGQRSIMLETRKASLATLGGRDHGAVGHSLSGYVEREKSLSLGNDGRKTALWQRQMIKP